MNGTPSNPPAFPRPYSEDIFGDHPREMPAQTGLSMRDWFAGQALIATLIADTLSTQQGNDDMTLGTIAEESYRLADAMLAEREKNR